MKDTKKDKKKDKKKNPSSHQRENTASSGNLDDIYVDVKKNKWNYGIVCLLILFVFLSFYMQYRFEVNQRQHHTGESEEVNHYEVLGLENGATRAEIRKAYRELAKVWHPDKNPDCKSCQEKFKLIAKSYEHLTEEMARGSDDSKMGKSMFNSSPFYLTTKNYHRLVEQSNDFWVILVYEGQSGNNHNKYVAEVLDEVSVKYHNIVKFGVIDVLRHENLLHFLPFKFQYFPNIFTLLHGHSELFENFDLFSVTTLNQFVEQSFINNVELVSDYGMKSLLPSEEEKIKYTELYWKVDLIKDMQLKVFVVSSKNYIDLITKDFARTYEKNVKIYQNELGYYNSVSINMKYIKSCIFTILNELGFKSIRLKGRKASIC